jgi:hypothetical protein
MDKLNELSIGTSKAEGTTPSSLNTKSVVSEQLVHIDLRDERLQDVIGRVSDAIKGSYRDAEFLSYIGTNPLGVYIEVYTASDHFTGILRVLDEKLGNLQIAAGVPVCVLPRQKAAAQAA